MITSFDLSFAAIDILAQGLRLDCRLFPFQIPSFGTYLDDRTRITQAVRDDLHRRGPARSGDLVPEVEAAVRLLAEHDIAIAVVGNSDSGGGLCARASMTARNAGLVMHVEHGLRFLVVRPEALIRSVVQLLPSADAGPGQSVTITQPGSPPPSPDQGFAVRSVVRAPRTSADVQLRVVQDILRRPRLGAGYFVVAEGQRRAPGLSWMDTDAGRYLCLTRAEERGDTNVTYFPADAERVAHKVGELVDTLRRTR
ncbi:ESX secretion-associated protein EspG [Actinokineospora sp.]|uniref:ESX secretion-associated protein EspG n=1 Tax=Actinokineospora sp. TaxID=1872133 RepID=UPI0040375F4D